MKTTQPQQHTEEQLKAIFTILEAKPEHRHIEESFSASMKAVTKLPRGRILDRVPQETYFISTFYMTHIQKILGITGATLMLVLVVGYVTISNQKFGYDDITSAALEDGSSDITFNDQDTMGDVQENDGSQDQAIVPGDTAIASTQSVNTTLAALDTIFANDDVNDSGLQTWFTDTSASDELIQPYEI
jgi:hypothetical protein